MPINLQIAHVRASEATARTMASAPIPVNLEGERRQRPNGRNERRENGPNGTRIAREARPVPLLWRRNAAGNGAGRPCAGRVDVAKTSSMTPIMMPDDRFE